MYWWIWKLKYIYWRPNKADKIKLHSAINFWSEGEEQSVERTSKIGLIVVELWSCITRSKQALTPHKHSLLTSTDFSDRKQMTLEGSQWPKPMTGFSMTEKPMTLKGSWWLFFSKSQNRNQNISRTETRIFQWLETSEIRMTRRWWCGTDLMKLQLMNGSPWTAMGALQHNKPKTRMAISWRVYVGCWRFLYQNDRLDA